MLSEQDDKILCSTGPCLQHGPELEGFLGRLCERHVLIETLKVMPKESLKRVIRERQREHFDDGLEVVSNGKAGAESLDSVPVECCRFVLRRRY